jgi:hypothetical protein
LFDASLQRGEASAIESDRLRDPIGPSTSRAETGEDAPERPVRTPVARAATPGEPAGRDPPGAGGGSAQRRSTKHIRTLRRDLEALETAGYPLLTERVDGQTRWRLADGSRAPAIGFSPTELMTLAVSRDLLRPLEGTALRSALDAAVTKATAALPPGGPDLVRQMRDWLSVPLGPAPEAPGHHRPAHPDDHRAADRPGPLLHGCAPGHQPARDRPLPPPVRGGRALPR